MDENILEKMVLIVEIIEEVIVFVSKKSPHFNQEVLGQRIRLNQVVV